MNRQAPALSRFVTRLVALGSACGITALIVVVHAADLSTLGSQDQATSSSAIVVANTARPAGS